MKLRIVIVLIVFLIRVPLGCLADVEPQMPSNFSVCVRATGADYTNALASLLSVSGLQEKLGALVAVPNTMSLSERRIARIVTARMNHPEYFAQYQQFVRDLRASKDRPLEGGRHLIYSGAIRQFMTRGPEKTTVTIRDGFVQTELGHEAKRKEIERWSDAQVAEGKTRNATMRLAVLEYMLKSLDAASSFEVEEMIELVPDVGDEDAKELKNELLAQRDLRVHQEQIDQRTKSSAPQRENYDVIINVDK